MYNAHAHKVKLGQSTTYGKTGVCTAMETHHTYGIKVCKHTHNHMRAEGDHTHLQQTKEKRHEEACLLCYHFHKRTFRLH